MIDENDWRLASDNDFLSDLEWQLKLWRQTRENWDHDHCEFCGVKFMNIDDPEIQSEGYTNPDEYYWICKTCFNDFREKYHWKEHKTD